MNDNTPIERRVAERRQAERRQLISDCLAEYEGCRRREEQRRAARRAIDNAICSNWMERFDAARSRAAR